MKLFRHILADHHNLKSTLKPVPPPVHRRVLLHRQPTLCKMQLLHNIAIVAQPAMEASDDDHVPPHTCGVITCLCGVGKR
jgi:hypothetical protein